ncbi:MAG: hypothetical protein EXS10_09765 [Phycisphaerales bacterium]|nr:hypothetical protein [Phycisphaerales bacterium]
MAHSNRINAVSFALAAATATLLLAAGMPAFAQDAPTAPAKAPSQGAQDGELAPARGGARGQGQGAGGARGGRGENPSMGSSMKSMNRAMKSLKDSIGDASKTAENLQFIGEMERGCILAKNAPLPPGLLVGATDDAAKAKLGSAFRKDMIKLAQALLELELAVMNGKLDDAKSMLEKIEEAREHGHKEFGVEEDD